MPVIRRAGKPYLDNQGFWVDLDVNYGGGFKMTIETKINVGNFERFYKIWDLQKQQMFCKL
jgi:hypothetical protein